MAKNREFFTSESVTEGHPDKMADQISDSILDAILAKDKNARVACETLVTTGMVHVVGEISTTCYVDIPHIVRETIRDIGYTRAKYGFDCDTCGVLVSLDEQSPDMMRSTKASSWSVPVWRLKVSRSWERRVVTRLGVLYHLPNTSTRLASRRSPGLLQVA